jgi:SAM-dependent methyltransferase
MTTITEHLIPLQTRFVRPLADTAERQPWVPARLARGLRRIDGTCRVDARSRSNAAPATPKVSHPIAARLYAGQARKAEELGLAERRAQLLAGLSGRVIEIGAGTGSNFRHYPPTVTEVVAVEPEAYLRGHAEQSANDADVAMRVLDAAAEALPFEDGDFDAAVASLVLCSVADPAKALAELFRVTRPGGELRFNEHVRSRSQSVSRIQLAADRLGWPRVAGGCHLSRDTEALMTASGFEIRSLDRYSFRIPPLDPSKPHIIGVATRPVSRG